MHADLTPAAGHHRVLAVVAHPDDETFGCGSLLLRSAAAGSVTGVCCATRGEAGEPVDGAPRAPAGLGAEREAELRAAAYVLDVSVVEVLGFADSGMSGPCPADGLAGAEADVLEKAVARCVEEFAADALLTLDGGDGHRDHARIRDATLRVARERRLPVYLHCLPRSLMDRWVTHMNAHRPEVEHLTLGQLGTPDAEVDLVLDTAAHLARREEAIARHRTQVSPFDGLPPDLRRAFLTRDHLRVVQP